MESLGALARELGNLDPRRPTWLYPRGSQCLNSEAQGKPQDVGFRSLGFEVQGSGILDILGAWGASIGCVRIRNRNGFCQSTLAIHFSREGRPPNTPEERWARLWLLPCGHAVSEEPSSQRKCAGYLITLQCSEGGVASCLSVRARGLAYSGTCLYCRSLYARFLQDPLGILKYSRLGNPNCLNSHLLSPARHVLTRLLHGRCAKMP